MIKRPMLAGTVEDAATLPYPMIASPKIDGIRAITMGGRLLSRSLKQIPNRHIRETLERVCPEGLDGELWSGSTFQECTSAVMAHDGEPEFAFFCFDYFGVGAHGGDVRTFEYRHRIALLESRVFTLNDPRVHVVPTQEIRTLDELNEYEAKALAGGFEGVMLRRPEGPYKEGRSTLREGWLLKLKRFEDAEAVVVGFEELRRNENEATTNELGLTKRSSAKAGKVAAGTLGALVVDRGGVVFNIGAGFTEANRDEIWNNRDAFLHSIVKFKHQPHGAKDAPRLPVFLGFRSADDS